MNENNRRLVTLDAMRGIAAILVAVFHLRNVGLSQVKSGYLAVDLFFLLSGFVIAKTYDSRLNGGLELWRFVVLRYIRLYPLFAVGLALAVVQRYWQTQAGLPNAMTAGDIAMSLGFEFFMLPSPTGNDLYPLNLPGWSLFFEFLVNVIYGSVLFKLSVRRLVYVCILSGCGLAWLTVAAGGISHGPHWEGFGLGFLRALFAFTLGMTLSRIHKVQPRTSRLALVPVLVLFVVLWIPPRGDHWVVYELIVVMIVAPMLVVWGASFNPPSPFYKAGEVAGDISYAIYAIHYPLLFMCGWWAMSMEINRFVWMPIFLVALLLTAWWLNRYFDIPVRARLNAGVRREPGRSMGRAIRGSRV